LGKTAHTARRDSGDVTRQEVLAVGARNPSDRVIS
jgi:hypothetical protein